MRMMKIRAVMTFAIAQVALAKQHASRRSMNIVVEDRAIWDPDKLIEITKKTNERWLACLFIENSVQVLKCLATFPAVLAAQKLQ